MEFRAFMWNMIQSELEDAVGKEFIAGVRNVFNYIISPVVVITDHDPVVFPVSAEVTGSHALDFLEFVKRSLYQFLFRKRSFEKRVHDNEFPHVIH